MRSLFARALLVALVFTLAPPATQLEMVSIPEVVTEDVAVSISTDSVRLTSAGAEESEAHRSDPVAAPIPFSMVGFRLPDGVDMVRVRTAGDDGEWDEWYELDRGAPEEGPDAGSPDDANDRWREYTEPIFIGEATRFQVEIPTEEVDDLDGDVEVSATVLDTDGLSGGPVTRTTVSVEGPVAEASAAPRIISREQWGAVPYKGTPGYDDDVDLAVVHHSAGSNDYTQAQAAGIVRGIQRYHQDSNGWSDIGYNMLVDRFGNLYEGRAGGLTRGVVGAHSAGYNTGSFGISVLGNYYGVDAPQAVYEALADGIAWKAAIHGFDPLGTTSRTANGAKVRTVAGHGDVGSTLCPGKLGDRLWWIRSEAAKRAPSKLALGAGPVPAGQFFADVPVSATHHDNIMIAHRTDVLLGYTSSSTATFKPGKTLTRGDMARAVAIAMDLEPYSESQWKGRFKDLDDVAWLARYIVPLVDAGVVQGYPDGTFKPQAPLRRDQMATFLAKALKLPATTPNFTDVRNTKSPHYLNIGAVQRAGVTTGTTALTYDPGGTMRRDQSASLLVRAFDLVLPPEPEPEVAVSD